MVKEEEAKTSFNSLRTASGETVPTGSMVLQVVFPNSQ